MSDVILETTGASKFFGGLAAVQDVSMQLHEGEILGLIGPNGAGKTTFVNIITNLLPISAGKVIFKNQDITGEPPYRIARLGIARTFQVVKPFRNMTVRENVAVGAMYGAGGGRRNAQQALHRADEVLDFVGLGDHRLKGADQLTLAAMKRLELAKALAMDPEVLFLDEVMAGLNPREIETAMSLIQHITRDPGTTVRATVVIEHVMKAIVGICQRVFVLHFGRKLAEGTPEEVLNDSEVVTAYLGEKFAQRARQRNIDQATGRT